MPRAWGDIMVSLLALCTAFAGSQLWGVVRFVLHRYRATPEPRPDIHHLVQASLRNSQTSIRLLLDTINIAWSGRRPPPLRALAPLFLPVAAIALAFSV